MRPDPGTISPASTYDLEYSLFPGRRSVVRSTQGIVACTQPLAAHAGQRILRNGGNAADAAVAVAAALNMTEPSSTGIGGDVFCLFYNAETKKIHALNGSGRCSARSSLERIRLDLGLKPDELGNIPVDSALSVTVPGAAAGWVDTVEKYGSGKLTIEQILTPAIELGEEAFPVSDLEATFWKAEETNIRNASPNFGEMLKSDSKAKDGKRAPGAGELFKNPTLANTFRLLARHGKKGFYEGVVASAIIKVVQDRGGHLTMEDLKHHAECGSEEVDAISLIFSGQNVGKVQTELVDGTASGSDKIQGVEVWEHPPNGQGIVALMALGILEELERTGQIKTFVEGDHNSAEYLHALIESLRIALVDANWWVTDPDSGVPTQELISRPYLAERAKLFDPKRANKFVHHGSPAHNHSDTVYLAVTDKFGNGMSFINSNYTGFGSCIIPKGCGFTLQNRGASFTLQTDHPNVIAPRKRPYHTIIPAIITNPNDQSLHTVYGVMGGFMQPQGHVQVLFNMLVFNYSPQSALDAPRFCIGAGYPVPGKTHDENVYLEDGISAKVIEELKAMGHDVVVLRGAKRGKFGRGQVIRCHKEGGKLVYSAGSDPRGDGAALPV